MTQQSPFLNRWYDLRAFPSDSPKGAQCTVVAEASQSGATQDFMDIITTNGTI